MTPHWNEEQQAELYRAMDSGACVGFVVTESDGETGTLASDAYKGVRVDNQSVDLTYGTLHPHKMRGSRVWIAVFEDVLTLDDCGYIIVAKSRRVLGEVLFEEVVTHSVGAVLGRKDLAYANLEGVNFVGRDMRCADFDRSVLVGAKCAMANFQGASFNGACLVGADLHGALLMGANFDSARLVVANLDFANLAGANLVGADAMGASFVETYLAGTTFERASLGGARLVKTNCAGANFSETNIDQTHFSEEYLCGVHRPTGDLPPGWVRNKGGVLTWEGA